MSLSGDRTFKGAKAIGRQIGRDPETVRRYVKAGLLPAVKLNGRTSPLTIRASEIEAFLHSRRSEAPAAN